MKGAAVRTVAPLFAMNFPGGFSMTKSSWLCRTLLVTTALALPGIAHAQDAQQQEDVLPSAEEQEFEESASPDVSIPGGAIIVTGRRRLDETRSSEQVVNVLSTEDIARTGEGDIAGALGRVTGLSVVGNGYVYVRGLGDRYSLALLNGLPLPSPEPLKRVVPLDIFPTNVVASSLVQKSYSANFPGEFGGGVVNLTTVAVPDESFINVGMGVGADTETTFSFGYSYYGSGLDWTGFDNGSRDNPSSLQAFLDSGARLSEGQTDEHGLISQLVRDDFAVAQKLGNVPVDYSADITMGHSFDAGEAIVGLVATVGYENEWRTRDIIQQRPEREDLTALRTDARTVNTENNVKLNALLAAGVELGDHRIRFTNLFIHDTIKQTRLSEQLDTNSGDTRLIQDTAWYERQLFNSQIVAELQFDDLGVDLRGGYANSQREAPFESSFLYAYNESSSDPLRQRPRNLLTGGALGQASVAFSDLNEDLWFGGIDLDYLLTDRLGVGVGYSYTDTFRTSSRRQFSIRAPSGNPEFDQGASLFRPDYLIRPPLIEYFDYSLSEDTEGSPAFSAGLEIHAGYGKINWEFIDYLTLDLGVRYETADQAVATLDVFTNPVTEPFSGVLSNDYWLPGATLTWEATPELQLRLNASKTIARPQFRELLPVLYYDPDTNRSFRGNPLLEDSELFNAEARVEYYLGGPDRVSVAGFYKDIENPIETSIQFGDNGTTGEFANAPQAQLWGVEVDFVKYFDLNDWGGVFDGRRFFTIANYTYTSSELKVGPDDIVVRYQRAPTAASNVFVDGSKLTGQSDHLANLQIGLESEDGLSQQTLLLTYASERVVGRGDGAFPDIIEDPGFRLDFVWRQGLDLFGKESELKFQIRNILGENNEEFQQSGDSRIEVNTYDLGTKVSLSLSTEF